MAKIVVHPGVASAGDGRRLDESDDDRTEHAEQLPLSKAAEHLLDECRMSYRYPALFGFQLIAVFSPGSTRN